MNLDKILKSIGETGRDIYNKDAGEGSSGNISCFYKEKFKDKLLFTEFEEIDLPFISPNLVGGSVLITGSGCRLRDLYDYPDETLSLVEIKSQDKGIIYYSPNRLFTRPTVEFNSHLAINNLCLGDSDRHFIVHAQTPYLTYLSHLKEYEDFEYFNKRILRWEVETIVNMPTGIGIVPFAQPGSEKLMERTLALIPNHNIILWSKHGVIARSPKSVKNAWDIIEYAECAAKYEYLDLINKSKGTGIDPKEIVKVMENLQISQTIF
ncbi:MAG: class II aldolase/adducin family protein [Abditibacteriota bacterium]|nr:class II aldolase/adducin family protein [Abditibacteriota bacterium]